MIYPLKPARTVDRGGPVSTFQRAGLPGERHADDDPPSLRRRRIWWVL